MERERVASEPADLCRREGISLEKAGGNFIRLKAICRRSFQRHWLASIATR